MKQAVASANTVDKDKYIADCFILFIGQVLQKVTPRLDNTNPRCKFLVQYEGEEPLQLTNLYKDFLEGSLEILQ